MFAPGCAACGTSEGHRNPVFWWYREPLTSAVRSATAPQRTGFAAAHNAKTRDCAGDALCRVHPHVFRMSRAFVHEESYIEELPDRTISEHPNLVTEQGLEQIEQALGAARRAYGEAQEAKDRGALAKAARDLRYWNARHASAKLTTPRPNNDSVQFGCTVTIARGDGRTQTFRIVGEDEADPSHGSISQVAPLARALLGKHVGDVVKAGHDDAEITAVR